MSEPKLADADGVASVTLPDFLLARIAEDEEAAEMNGPTVSAIPDRALAECEAKRRIIHDWDTPIPDFDGAVHLTDDAEHLFRLLALPYAAHPDYREDWLL